MNLKDLSRRRTLEQVFHSKPPPAISPRMVRTPFSESSNQLAQPLCLKNFTPESGRGTGSSASRPSAVPRTMAHVADFSRTRRHSEFFVKQINKLEEIVSNLKT